MLCFISTVDLRCEATVVSSPIMRRNQAIHLSVRWMMEPEQEGNAYDNGASLP